MTRCRRRLAAGPITVYHGCDPSADSLHIGNLIGLLMLRRFQEAGHRPIALAGGATGMIGDPGGRSEERNLLDPETLARNVEAIKGQINRILGDPSSWELVDNMTWTADLRLLDFLRDVGKHVTVNQMVARESVKTRIAGEHGISYTEFSYMLLQAHDYLWLHDNRGCELQVGGSDQWGNLLSGVDLIRRTRGVAVHALRVAAHPRRRRQQARQDDRRADLARRRQDEPVRALPALPPVARRRRAAQPRVAHAPADRGGRRHRRSSRRAPRTPRGPAGTGAARSSGSCTANRTQPRPRPRPSGPTCATSARTTWAPSRARSPRPTSHPPTASPLVDLLVRTDEVRGRKDAVRLIQQGGVYLGGEQVDSPDLEVGADRFEDGRLLVGIGKKRRHLFVLRPG